ncbi:MAG: helix-turn-helix domain-containing protein [Caulobacterales bacterium]|nr:helix-turn-helix domain-containing protein [Caulobacterales bacterium]
MPTRKVAVLALPGCHHGGVGTALDLCHLANRYTHALFAGQDGPKSAMRAVLITRDGAPARFADGRSVAVDAAMDEADVYDIVLVPSFEAGSDAKLARLLGAASDVSAWLRAQRRRGARIAASGAGVLVVAQSGLLDGGEAANPIEHAALMRRRFPRVRADGGADLVRWSGVHTANAIAAEPSLMLRVLEDAVSPILSDHLSKWTRISDATFGFETAVSGGDDVVDRAQAWLQERFTQKCKITDLAQAMALSQKTLTRRFNDKLGVTPQAYLQSLRVEAAKRQLTHTNRRVERIANLVGYGDVGFFKEKFAELVGASPSVYRARMRAAGERGRKLGPKES